MRRIATRRRSRALVGAGLSGGTTILGGEDARAEDVRTDTDRIEREVEEVTVEGGANVLRAVSFGAATE